MDGKVSRLSIIGSIIAKDVKAFSRDIVWAGLTVLGLVAYVTLFWFLPNTVNETITVGVYHTDLGEMLDAFAEGEEEALDLVEFESAADLEAAVEGEFEFEEGFDEGLKDRIEDVRIGIAFPEDFVTGVATGERTTVDVYVDAAVPEEIRGAMSSFVREIAYGITAFAQAGATGQDLTPEEAMEAAYPVVYPAEEEIILGEDRAGDQIPLRDKMKPMLAYFVLMIESFALAGLLATEVQFRTVNAVLVTPARVGDVLTAKGVFGTLLAFSQAALILVLVGALSTNPALVLLTVLIGAMMVAGIGMYVGAAGKDFMGTMFLGILFLIPLIIPTFSALYPGTASTWVKVLPSYGVVEALVGVSLYGEGFSDVLPELAVAVGWLVVIFAAGWFALKRKVEAI